MLSRRLVHSFSTFKQFRISNLLSEWLHTVRNSIVINQDSGVILQVSKYLSSLTHSVFCPSMPRLFKLSVSQSPQIAEASSNSQSDSSDSTSISP